MNREYALALNDLYLSVLNWPIWSRLGWMEIRRRYRRTLLGPFWTSFNVAVMVFSMGFLWAALFNQPVARYMPYLTAGTVTWQLIATFVNEGSNTFISNSGLLTTMQIPKIMLIFTVVWRNIIVFFHNLAIYLVVMLLWQIPVTKYSPLFLLGLLLLSLNGCWIAIVVAVVGARFRDIPQLLGGLVTIAMFLTPVMWERTILAKDAAILRVVDYNPFYHLVEVVRAPLLGEMPRTLSWVVVTLMIPTGFAFALWVFSRFRRRITFWL